MKIRTLLEFGSEEGYEVTGGFEAQASKKSLKEWPEDVKELFDFLETVMAWPDKKGRDDKNGICWAHGVWNEEDLDEEDADEYGARVEDEIEGKIIELDLTKHIKIEIEAGNHHWSWGRR